jgi:membrane protease YdiL (CAAX protease family)
MQPVASLRHTLILLAILGAVSFATFRANTSRGTGPAPNRVALYASIIGAELLLLRYVAIGIHVRGVKLRDLVGRFVWYDVLIAAAFWFLSRYALMALHRLMHGTDSHTTGLVPSSSAVERVFWIAASITAGVVEEFVFRGYLQRQFSAWTRSAAAGVLIQAIIFGASHGYQGAKSMSLIAIYGVMFGLLAWWRKSLVPGMLAHAWTDIFNGLTG